MDRERLEELLLVGIGIVSIAFLLPASIPQRILTTLIIAFGLIAILVLRNIDWRKRGSNPFDWVLLLGILLTMIHMASFYAWEKTILSGFLVLLLVAFYFLMAFLLYQHRWLFRNPRDSSGP